MDKQESIKKSKEKITETFADAFDVVSRSMQAGDAKAHLLYIKSLCEESALKQFIMIPMFETKTKSDYETYLRSFPDSLETDDVELMIQRVVEGHIIVFLDETIFLVDLKNVEASPITDTQLEPIIQGPQDAFNEKLITNLNLIRNRYHSVHLQVDVQKIGKRAPSDIAVLYDHQLVDKKLLAHVKEKLSRMDVDMLQSITQLHKYLIDYKWSILPTLVITERPDRVVKNLAEGKIILLDENSPTAMIIPSILFDFLSSMDDHYQQLAVRLFLTSLRYLAFLISTFLPGLYILFVAYNPEITRIQLTLTIAGTRLPVPYPAIVEILFMLLILEFLIEASARLPRTIGDAAPTVGGLILGQAASEAGLVSNIMIIIVSAIAISSFVMPVNALGFSVRMIKYFVMALTFFFGYIGFMISVLGLILFFANHRSFGKPFFKLWNKEKEVPTT